MANICVYCGSNPGNDPIFLEHAVQLGRYLAKEGHTLIYGGGNVGLMNVLANATLEAGGAAIGIITEQLVALEVAHEGLTECIIVDSMHARKAKMAALADCFIALPGGTGTLEEIIEVFVWTQLDLHRKACGLLNANGFYRGLKALLEQMVRAGMMKATQRDQLLFREDPIELVEDLLAYTVVPIDKRLDHP
jgi:uncharacterized protein (TIGR00730 family)